MLARPSDVLSAFPVRKSKKQKQAFRDAVQSYVTSLGYISNVEKGSFGCHNVVIGDPEKARYLITAHYDTCARMPVPNLITPCNFWLFMAYQLLLVALVFAFAFLFGIIGWLLVSLGCAMLGEPLLEALAMGVALIPVFGYFGVWIILILMMVGPSNPSNANDNTSGVVTVLEIARSLPDNQRHKVCFVLFDLEEAGLIGSASYRKKHKKASDNQIVLNLDCVGDGDHIMLFPTKKLRKNTRMRGLMYKCCGYFGKKSVVLREKGFSVYPSDQANFPYGVGICALNKGKLGLYLSRIHTKRDTILEETNVNILRAGLISMISCDAV